MVARRDITPGEVVFTDQPAVIGEKFIKKNIYPTRYSSEHDRVIKKL